jgi:glycosyltransferase involved in cell wall biosynthesis
MKVLLLTRRYAGTDGHSTTMNNIAYALLKRNIDVKIGAFDFIQDPPTEIHKIQLSYFKDVIGFGKVANKFDIIHNFQGLTNYLARFTHKPFVFHYMGASTSLQIKNLKLSAMFSRHFIKKCFVSSQVSADDLYALTKLGSIIIPLVVDPIFLGAIKNSVTKKGEPHLLTVTRMMDYKRNDELIYALSKLLQVYPKAYLQIIGHGPKFNEFRKLVSELGLSKSVELMGLVKHSDIVPIYASCDVYVSTSGLEAYPYPFLEAMALGKPIVASDLPVHKEILAESQAGEFYKSGNLEDMINKIVQVYKNKDHYAENAKAYAQKRNIDNLSKILIPIYEELSKI